MSQETATEEFVRRMEATIAEMAEAAKAGIREGAERLAKQHPSIAQQLREHAELRCQRLDSDARQPLTPEERLERDSRDYWEHLKLLASVIPELDIVAIHDEYVARYRRDLERSAAEKQRILDTLRDIQIDYHTGRLNPDRLLE